MQSAILASQLKLRCMHRMRDKDVDTRVLEQVPVIVVIRQALAGRISKQVDRYQGMLEQSALPTHRHRTHQIGMKTPCRRRAKPRHFLDDKRDSAVPRIIRVDQYNQVLLVFPMLFAFGYRTNH